MSLLVRVEGDSPCAGHRRAPRARSTGSLRSRAPGPAPRAILRAAPAAGPMGPPWLRVQRDEPGLLSLAARAREAPARPDRDRRARALSPHHRRIVAAERSSGRAAADDDRADGRCAPRAGHDSSVGEALAPVRVGTTNPIPPRSGAEHGGHGARHHWRADHSRDLRRRRGAADRPLRHAAAWRHGDDRANTVHDPGGTTGRSAPAAGARWARAPRAARGRRSSPRGARARDGRAPRAGAVAPPERVRRHGPALREWRQWPAHQRRGLVGAWACGGHDRWRAHRAVLARERRRANEPGGRRG